MLLKGLVETVLRGEDLLPGTVPAPTADGSITNNPHTSEEANGTGDGGYRDGITDPRTGSPSPTAVKDPLLDAWSDGGGVAWEDLAAPAAALCAACSPWDSAQLAVLDGVLGEIFGGASDPEDAGG